MNKLKFITTVLVLNLLVPMQTFSQEPQPLDQSWKKLEARLIQRSNISMELASKLVRTKKMNRDILNKSMHKAIELQITFDSIVIMDRVWIQKVSDINSKFTYCLTQMLEELEKHVKLKEKPEIASLCVKIEESENKICLENRRYNALCKKEK